ncbi:MAG: hypothetical protein M1358_09630 [Chloroflexi bacterium]|nr:hypothetical protein [Chloroflexota bacterium]
MRLPVLLLVLALLAAIGLWQAPSVYSQDLGSELSAALAANEQAVETIQRAEAATSPNVARVLVLQAVSEAQTARAHLRDALALATTDEQRSRIEGLIDHVDAAINAGLEAQTAADDRIAGVANAVRGELVEALSELRPFAPVVAPPQPIPPTLPKAGDGWADARFLLFLGLSGLASIVVGLRVRTTVIPV